MRRLYIILFFLIIAGGVHKLQAQGWTPFSIVDTIPIKQGTKKGKLYRLSVDWLEKERGTKLIARNRKERKVKGRGYFVYHNYIRLEDAYVSPKANSRTKGSIVFDINIDILDSIIVVKHTNFVHEAYFSEYGSLSFGRLMDFKKAPPNTCMEVEQWCDSTWADLKRKSRIETGNRMKRLIPAILIRKRTFRVKDVFEKRDSLDVEENAEAYMTFEKQIVYDKRNQKSPPPPKQMSFSEELAAKNKPIEEEVEGDGYDDYDEYDEYDEYGEETSEGGENVAEGDSDGADSEEKSEAKSDSEDSDEYGEYDEYDDYDDFDSEDSNEKSEKDEPKGKEDKKAKGKKEKPEKKSKKSDDDDDYGDEGDDDYDDYDGW